MSFLLCFSVFLVKLCKGLYENICLTFLFYVYVLNLLSIYKKKPYKGELGIDNRRKFYCLCWFEQMAILGTINSGTTRRCGLVVVDEGLLEDVSL